MKCVAAAFPIFCSRFRLIVSLLEIERVPTSKITMAKFIGCDLIPAIFSWTQTSIVNWGMARNFYPRPSCPTFPYRAILRRDNCLYNRWSWDDIIYSSLIRRKPKHHASCGIVSAGIALCFLLRSVTLLCLVTIAGVQYRSSRGLYRSPVPRSGIS